MDDILAATDQRAAAEERAQTIEAQINAYAAEGHCVIRANMPSHPHVPELASRGNSPEDVEEYLHHALFRALDRHRFHVQVFVGMSPPTPGYKQRTRVHGYFALNDPCRIAAMHPLFDMYADCSFEIVNAANLSNMDVVQAARIYPNVVPGGLWWFNFRASTYQETMQYRLEALPASRCTLLASDARCIEWAYCKTWVVKQLLAEFLLDQIEHGWLDRETALYVAREWLHDAAARLYQGAGQ